MIQKLFEDILKGENVRASLSQLRVEIKDQFKKEQVEEFFDCDNIETVIHLLQAEDAKIRKNCALFMGDMEMDALFLRPLWEAYLAENQLFVKSAYLTAMSHMEYDLLLPKIKERLEDVLQIEITPENEKHIREEQKCLNSLILNKEGVKQHRFIGQNEMSDIILLTNRSHAQSVLMQLQENENLDTSRAKIFQAGIRIRTSQLDEILPIRTYQEILFIVPGMQTLPMDAKSSAEIVANSELLDFLKKRHKGDTPFYFRIELKSKMALDKKTKFAKSMAGEIEKQTKRQLINSTDHYEVELRLIESKSGIFNVLVKLHTITFDRFFYRKEVVAASIKPVNAALLVALAKKHMVSDAQVLDPFCGVGTMLIERQMQVKANTSYGIDIYNEAIKKAYINMEAAGQIIHFVNKDFFEFTHEYAFDEIFTNMPFATGHKGEDVIYDIYSRFFEKSKSLLRKGGTLILYTHNRELIPKLAGKSGYQVIEKIPVMQKEGTDLFILR